MTALDDLIHGGHGANPIGTIGNDALAAPRGTGLFGMTPEQQMMALTALNHLGQTIQAAGSRGRMAPPAFPVGALAQLTRLQQARQQEEQQKQQLQAMASAIGNDPSIPETVRGMVAQQVAMGDLGALKQIQADALARAEEERQRGRMVTRELAPGTGVFVNEDTLTGRAIPLGTVAETWSPDPRDPDLIRSSRGRVEARPETPAEIAARQLRVQEASDSRAVAAQTARDERQRKGLEQERDLSANNQVFNFAKFMEQRGLPQYGATLAVANSRLARYVTQDADGNITLPADGIPGLNPQDQVPGSPVVLSEEAKQNRQAMMALKNAYLRAQSGLTVTDQEAARTIDQMMTGSIKYNARDFANAFQTLVRGYNAQAGNAAAGLSDRAIEIYANKPGAHPLTPMDPFKRAYTPGEVVTAPNGKRYRVLGGDWHDPELAEIK